ncbi:mRNA export protein Dss1 [Schizosaccharomyces cryophilus OY26]|uniref:26S proteasome complex subunit SEM1 n=1 Tax=Schizosaccharomyces cryophilus (strain OY26 / ATCC MYA-4695 / CBS 11777 / NBRC 106824 / NRRL Y48691) TaxID=653667 RepID=S9VZQ4_SCHCR|nr:mRNA export protein Dss1 [Schizosaccharomyces cryophilus OY26]EPY53158.1 mRNA export protein Dss1 [Schizosaccharomyces cryophilus OY26]
MSRTVLPSLENLEDDDEFEDFATENWPMKDTELDTGDDTLWENNWDDEDIGDDDFSAQLQAELKKKGVATN